VGSFAANAFGLHDMHGNVWEWVEDCYHEKYNGAPTDGSAWIPGDCRWRVIRGGSWNNLPQDVRAAIRDNIAPDYRYNYLGFRVARTLSP
jgi:formylglycine-generating enzyme required for sulfatase activity